MAKKNTNFFGELIIAETKDEEINIKFIGRDIRIALPEWIINDKNKVKRCFEAMGKYIEIDDIATKSILNNYPQNKRAKMNSYYRFCNLENNRIQYFGIINDDRKNIVENIMNKELKLIAEETNETIK